MWHKAGYKSEKSLLAVYLLSSFGQPWWSDGPADGHSQGLLITTENYQYKTIQYNTVQLFSSMNLEPNICTSLAEKAEA